MTERAASSGRPDAKASGTREQEDTVVRTALPGRISAKLTKAAEEHRATATLQPSTAGKKQPRRARLRLTRLDPWSVMKASFLLSVAFGIVTFVAVFIIWSVLGAAGVWDSINDTVASVADPKDSPTAFDIREYVGMTRVMGFTALVAAIDVILLTAIATLGAFLYNMAAALLGGIELTLAEDQR